jgi:hypothetical protein
MSKRAADRLIRWCLSIGLALPAAAPCVAASVPAWLDEGISKFNAAHPGDEIRYVDIKDSFVWYDLPKTAAASLSDVRKRLNEIVLANRYQPMDDEEIVTTARPPVASGRTQAKKCWSRSFVLTIQAQSDTKVVGGSDPAGLRQRLLTSLVCEDVDTWWAAFRVAE